MHLLWGVSLERELKENVATNLGGIFLTEESINQDNHLDNHTKIWDTVSTQTTHQKRHI